MSIEDKGEHVRLADYPLLEAHLRALALTGEKKKNPENYFCT